MKNSQQEDSEPISLSKAAEYLLEECRMVLPGIQALFGFQLIAVFNPTFAQRLGPGEQRLHLFAIALVAASIALIMTPAAYHRQRGGREISEAFISLSTRLLLWSMVPLGAGICLEFYLVAQLIVGGGLGGLAAVALVVVFVFLWGVLPRIRGLQKLASGGGGAGRADSASLR